MCGAPAAPAAPALPLQCAACDTPKTRQVHLCGSFTRWVETVPMAPVEGQPGVYSVVVHLPPG